MDSHWYFMVLQLFCQNSLLYVINMVEVFQEHKVYQSICFAKLPSPEYVR